jgi:monofunctional biosynthetic peptidoglycan transglycosylase
LTIQRPPSRRKSWGWLLWILVLIFVLPALWVVLYRFVNPPITLLMIVRSSHGIEREWRPIAQISPNLVDAAIASEDANFCTHHGFDESAIRAAWKSNEAGHKLRGGSTISMQTAKNVFLWQDRTWLRKGMEAYFTFLIETAWSKQHIMTVYLNVVEWGDGIYGAEAASQHYFHRPAKQLTAGEAAQLVAILPDPRQWKVLGEGISSRAATIEQRAAEIRVDGKANCIFRQP